VQDLGGGKLKNDRVQCFVPSEKISCNYKDYAVSGKNVIPGFDAEFFRKEDGDKVSAAARSVGIQAKGDGTGV
jgi:hypothetical protein